MPRTGYAPTQGRCPEGPLDGVAVLLNDYPGGRAGGCSK